MKASRHHISRFNWAIALILLFAANARSQGLGRYGAPFLTISPYARQVGMGEAFTALANDINVMRYNVGGLGQLRYLMLSTHFHKWIEDTQQGALEAALPTRFGTIGFNATYFSEGDLTEIGPNFQQTGKILQSNDLVLSLGYGKSLPVLNNKLSFGAGVKYIRQDLVGEAGIGAGLDVGALFAMKNLSFGATLQNLTISKIKFVDTEFLLPETVRGGLAVRVPFGPKYKDDRRFKINVGTDVAKLLGSPDDKVRVYSGAEVRFAEVFAVRGGYKFHDTELSRWGAGFGVIVPMTWLGRANAEVDYAYSPMAAFDSQSHRFSLSFNFGAIKQPRLDTLRIAEMQQQVAQELEAAAEAREAAERARTSAEEARLAATETEKRLKDLEAAWQAKLDSIRQIAASADSGAIEIAEQPGHNLLMTLRINFDFDKAIIRPPDYETMFKVVDILQTTQEAKVGLTGHTDNIGTDEYNMKLAEARMNNVMAFLVRHGIDAGRFFMPVPYGEWKPLTDNRTAENQFRNRRVEFFLYTGSGEPLIPEGSKIEKIQMDGDSTIVIVGNGRLNYITSFVGNPPRLILKFPKIYTPDARTFPINQGNFIQARMAYHPDERSTWVVFDLNTPPAQQPAWLVQDNRLFLPLRNGTPVEQAVDKRPNER